MRKKTPYGLIGLHGVLFFALFGRVAALCGVLYFTVTARRLMM